MPAQFSQARATVLSIGGMISGLMLLVLMIPSSGKTGATSLYGWILPAVLLLVILILANFKIKKAEADNISTTKEVAYGRP